MLDRKGISALSSLGCSAPSPRDHEAVREKEGFEHRRPLLPLPPRHRRPSSRGEIWNLMQPSSAVTLEPFLRCERESPHLSSIYPQDGIHRPLAESKKTKKGKPSKSKKLALTLSSGST